MNANELNLKLTQEIRELSTKKSKIQSEISELSQEDMKLKLSIKKSQDKLTELETRLTHTLEDECTSRNNVNELNDRAMILNNELSQKQAELEEVVSLMNQKREQAKAEIKNHADNILSETENKRNAMLKEVRVLKETADKYYKGRIEKADTEYQEIMKRASDKYSQKIQDALNNLVELNTNISEKNAEIVDLTESQEKKMTCLIEVESLLSERQAELDKINLAILDGNNQLGTLTQRELDQLNELQARYNELEETLTSTKTFHREEIKQLKIQLEAAHSSNEEELMTKLEACELAGSERANELQDLKSLLESKEETIAQLSSELEMAQLNLAADIDDKDTLILEKEYEIDALNQKLADLTAAHDEKLALLEKQIDDLHSSRSDDALTLIDLDEEKDLMRKEIEGLQNECEGLTEDKQALVAERDKLLEERDRLVQELDKALEETMMDLPMISDIEDNELLDQLKEEKLELETAKRDLQERVDSLEADLDRNMEELLTANQVLEDTVTQLSQLKETYNVEVNTLKAQLAAIPTDSHNAEDTEAINVLQTELNTLEEKRQKEIYALEEKRKKEVAHLQQQIQSFSSMQEEMRGLKSSYNIAITNQASLKAKFLEMGIVTLLSISSSLFTFKFAQDYFVYFGYVMIAACILDLLWCGYRLKENLAVATDMVNIEEQN